jgi:hypothetical protein
MGSTSGIGVGVGAFQDFASDLSSLSTILDFDPLRYDGVP